MYVVACDADRFLSNRKGEHKMNFFTKLFKKKSVVEIPPMPSWETVVEMMYDKHLDAFSDEVVKVIYSKDRSIRYIVLKDEKDLYNKKQTVARRFCFFN